MTLAPEKIGDKGQRFEIRFREGDAMPHKVLGWTETRRGALQMVKSWKTKPGVTHCWLYDRQEKRQRGCVSDASRTSLSAAPKPRNPTDAGYDKAVRPGRW